MKNPAKISLIIIFLLLPQMMSGHKYYFKQDQWEFSNLRLESVTLSFDNGNSITLTNSNLYTYTSATRISTITRSMVLRNTQNGAVVNIDPYTVEWPANKLQISVGSAPVYPLACWDPQITLISDLNSIYIDEEARLTVNRNGYTGSLDIFAGNNSSFNDMSFRLITIPENSDLISYIPDQHWNSFSQMLGGDMNAFLQNYYLRYEATFYYGVSNTSSFSLSPLSIGPFKLNPVLQTDMPPESLNKICNEIQLSPSHVPPPFKITARQGSNSKIVYDNFMNPTLGLDYAGLYEKTGFLNRIPIEITYSSTIFPSVVTRALVIDFLGQAPDTTGIKVDIFRQSCEEVIDGAIALKLPGKTPNFMLRVNIEGQTNAVTSSDSIYMPLLYGNYQINVEYQNNNVPLGCNVNIGELAVPLTDKLTIINIEETRPQSCYYRNDAELKIYTTGGVKDGPFTYYNFGIGTSTDSVFKNLAGNTTYTFNVTDAKGCVSNTLSYTTKRIDSLILEIADMTAIRCYGDKGSVTAVGYGGHAQFEYSLDGSTYQASGAFSELQGTIPHTLKIRDASLEAELCTTSISFNLPEPPKLEFKTPAYELSDYNGFNIRCYDDNSGEIRIYSQGGTGSPSYFLDGDSSMVQDSNRFVSLKAGTYQVSMFDANGCFSDTIKNITLSQPEGVKFNGPDIFPETCHETQDGRISGSLTGEPTSLQWYNSENIPLSEKTTKDLDGASAGSYKLLVRYNSDNCSVISPLYVIPETPVIELSLISHESCSDGINGGELKITGISNGKGPFSYSLNNGEYYEITSFPLRIKNLDAGEQMIEIHDNNFLKGGIYSEKCKASRNVTIVPKSAVLLTSFVTEPLCSGDKNGSVILEISGPDQPYVHTWFDINENPVGTGSQLNNIPSGKYRPKIVDSLNCSSLEPFITVTEPTETEFRNILTESASCKEITNGSINFGSQGGSGAHSYSINSGLSWSSVPYLTGLSYGNYHLLARDAHGCIADTVFVIEAFDPKMQLIDLDSVSCFGSNDGWLTFRAFNGKPENYTYYLSSGIGNIMNTTGRFYNLGNSDYAAFAKGSSGCFTDTLIYEIFEPDPLEIKLSLIDSASCGQPTGKIAYEILGGNGGYELIWMNNETGQTSDLKINELKTGEYLLNVKDRKECIQNSSIKVPDRPAPVITGIDVIDSTWCNLPLGKARVKVTGGSPGYRYLWDNSSHDTSAVAENLTEGVYHVIVSDRYNCRDEETISLSDGPEMKIIPLVENPHCGQKDGSVELSVSGGVKPFIFVWPDSVSGIPLTSGLMNQLGSGSYAVKIIDKVGCSKNFVINLDDLSGPEIIGVNTSKSWCNLPRGSARVLAGGGSPPYNFLWTKSGSDLLLGTNDFLKDLKAGNYDIKITDSDNCRTSKTVCITDSIELQPILKLTELDSAACNNPTGKLTVEMKNGLAPYYYEWDSGITGATLINIARGIYKVSAMDQRGCIDSLKIQLPDKKPPVLIFLASENSYCSKPTGNITVGAYHGRAPYSAYIISEPDKPEMLSFNPDLNLYAGTLDSILPSPNPYKIRVKDADGCESTEIGAIIGNYDPMSVHLVNITPVSCFGLSDGTAIVNVENGFGPYSYLWDKNTVDSNINSSLPAGAFSVTVTDKRGCVRNLNVTEDPITQPFMISLDREIIISPSCYGVCNGSISILASGGNGNYQYIWNNKDTIQNLTGLCAGEQFLTIRDSKNCNYNKQFILVNPEPMSDTDLPESITICSGQEYLANPGSRLNHVTWTSDGDYNSSEQIARIDVPGTYYLNGYSNEGCTVRDTIKLFVSDDLLDAQFLMMSQAYTGDTVIIIEVSWPVAENYQWDIPGTARIIDEGVYYKELVFDNAGNYYVQLTATLAGCTSVSGKYIEILDLVEDADTVTNKGFSLIQSFAAFPNPAVTDLNLEVELSVEKDIRIEIINAGNGVLTKIIQGHSTPKYSETINVAELQRGMYILRLTSGNEVKTKILIVK